MPAALDSMSDFSGISNSVADVEASAVYVDPATAAPTTKALPSSMPTGSWDVERDPSPTRSLNSTAVESTARFHMTFHN